MTDKAHTQNINTEVVIYTKEEPEAILDYIVNEFHRDATWWEARGGYTEETTYMIVTILSKYECVHLRRGLKNIDEHAFVVVKKKVCILAENTKSIYKTCIKPVIFSIFFAYINCIFQKHNGIFIQKE